MATIKSLQDANDALRQLTADGSFSNITDADMRDAVAAELLARGIKLLAATTDLSSVGADEAKFVYVSADKHFYEYKAGGTADGTTVFAAATTGFWHQVPMAAGGSSAWGGITGDIAAQVDLQTSLAAKADKSVNVAANNAIPFNKELSVMPETTMSGARTFTVNATGQILMGSCTISLIADGVNVPNLSAFRETSGSSGYVNVAGVRNELVFWNINNRYYVMIYQDKVDVPADTQTPANTTPAAPTVTGDDTANTLSASHALGTSEIVVSENGGAYVAYAGTINVGDVARAAGYWKFKIKAATGRNESAVADSPAFTVAPVGNTTPAAPTAGTVNDTEGIDSFDFTYSPDVAASIAEYEQTLDGGTTVTALSAKPLVVGNVAKAAGQVGVRVKAATGRNASAWLFNAQPFTVAAVATPLLSGYSNLDFPTNTNVVDTDNVITTSATNAAYGNTGLSGLYLPAGVSGRIAMKRVAADAQNCLLGFLPSNVQAGYASMIVTGGPDVGNSFTDFTVFVSGAPSTIAGVLPDGDWFGFYRDGATGNIYAQTSADGVTWTSDSGVLATNNGDLYIGIDVFGSGHATYAPGKGYYPQGLGLVAAGNRADGYTDIVYDNKDALLVESAHIWSNSTQDQTFGSGEGVMTAGLTGDFEIVYTYPELPANGLVLFGLNDTATKATYNTGMKVGCYIDGTPYPVRRVEGGTVADVSPSGAAGTMLKITRVGSTFKLYRSDDNGATWGTALYTYTYTNSAIMYPIVDVLGAARCSNPKYKAI